MDEKKIAEYLSQATEYDQLGKYDEVINLCNEIISEKADFAPPYYVLGCAYQKTGAYNKAIDSFKKAVFYQPDYVEAYNNLGIAYYNLQRYEKASEAFKKTIQYRPDFARGHCNLGNCCYALELYVEAVESYKMATKINSGYVKAYQGAIDSLLEIGDIDGALAEVNLLSHVDEELANDFIEKIFPTQKGTISN